MTNVRVAAEAKMSARQVAAQRSAIARSLAGVEASLAGTKSRVLSSLNTVPASTIEVDSAGLAALRANPSVSSITLDREYGLLLDSSTAVIQSDRLNQAGVLGNGWEGGPGRSRVVVIDTGFARNHNALVGRVASEACFSGWQRLPGRHVAVVRHERCPPVHLLRRLPSRHPCGQHRARRGVHRRSRGRRSWCAARCNPHRPARPERPLDDSRRATCTRRCSASST